VADAREASSDRGGRGRGGGRALVPAEPADTGELAARAAQAEAHVRPGANLSPPPPPAPPHSPYSPPHCPRCPLLRVDSRCTLSLHPLIAPLTVLRRYTPVPSATQEDETGDEQEGEAGADSGSGMERLQSHVGYNKKLVVERRQAYDSIKHLARIPELNYVSLLPLALNPDPNSTAPSRHPRTAHPTPSRAAPHRPHPTSHHRPLHHPQGAERLLRRGDGAAAGFNTRPSSGRRRPCPAHAPPRAAPDGSGRPITPARGGGGGSARPRRACVEWCPAGLALACRPRLAAAPAAPHEPSPLTVTPFALHLCRRSRSSGR
jgi:hypothetical protein